MSASVTNDRTIVILTALEQGYQDGNDILTLSLGESTGWSESSTAIAASRLADSGVIVTIAAGNEVCRLRLHLSFFLFFSFC